MVEITLKLKTPEVPNFVMVESTPGMRQEGFSEGLKVSIADLSEAQLEKLADDWKISLVNKSKKLREAR